MDMMEKGQETPGIVQLAGEDLNMNPFAYKSYTKYGTRKNIDLITYRKSINCKTAKVDSLAVFGLPCRGKLLFITFAERRGMHIVIRKLRQLI